MEILFFILISAAVAGAFWCAAALPESDSSKWYLNALATGQLFFWWFMYAVSFEETLNDDLNGYLVVPSWFESLVYLILPTSILGTFAVTASDKISEWRKNVMGMGWFVLALDWFYLALYLPGDVAANGISHIGLVEMRGFLATNFICAIAFACAFTHEHPPMNNVFVTVKSAKNESGLT